MGVETSASSGRVRTTGRVSRLTELNEPAEARSAIARTRRGPPESRWFKPTPFDFGGSEAVGLYRPAGAETVKAARAKSAS